MPHAIPPAIVSSAPQLTRKGWLRELIRANDECRYQLYEPFHHERELTLEAGDAVRVECRYDSRGRYHVRVIRLPHR